MAEVTAAQVWREIARQPFSVLGMATARGHGRTVGLVHAVHDGALWYLTSAGEAKVGHVRGHPEVSVTVPIPKRVPFLPWLRIPAATITVNGRADVLPREEVPATVWRALTGGLEVDGARGPLVAIRVRPHGEAVTYGVGVRLLAMRDTELARGRVPIDGSAG